MTGHREKDILEGGQHRAKVGDPNPVLGQTLDHVCHDVVAAAADRDAALLSRHGVHAPDLPKTLVGAGSLVESSTDRSGQ